MQLQHSCFALLVSRFSAGSKNHSGECTSCKYQIANKGNGMVLSLCSENKGADQLHVQLQHSCFALLVSRFSAGSKNHSGECTSCKYQIANKRRLIQIISAVYLAMAALKVFTKYNTLVKYSLRDLLLKRSYNFYQIQFCCSFFGLHLLMCFSI